MKTKTPPDTCLRLSLAWETGPGVVAERRFNALDQNFHKGKDSKEIAQI